MLLEKNIVIFLESLMKFEGIKQNGASCDFFVFIYIHVFERFELLTAKR